MKLYVPGCDEHDNAGPHPIFEGGKTLLCHGMREASPAEILAAARPHADLEAAARRCFELKVGANADGKPFGAYASDEQYRSLARAALDAALGGDE